MTSRSASAELGSLTSRGTQVFGVVNFTREPALWAKQIPPRKEIAFSYDTQLNRTNSPSACEPVIFSTSREVPRGEQTSQIPAKPSTTRAR